MKSIKAVDDILQLTLTLFECVSVLNVRSIYGNNMPPFGGGGGAQI